MAEWSNALVLKTSEGHTSGGSNPSFSAKGNPQLSLWVFCYQKRRKLAFESDLKQKTKHTKCVVVSMLAKDSRLGSRVKRIIPRN